MTSQSNMAFQTESTFDSMAVEDDIEMNPLRLKYKKLLRITDAHFGDQITCSTMSQTNEIVAIGTKKGKILWIDLSNYDDDQEPQFQSYQLHTEKIIALEIRDKVCIYSASIDNTIRAHMFDINDKTDIKWPFTDEITCFKSGNTKPNQHDHFFVGFKNGKFAQTQISKTLGVTNKNKLSIDSLFKNKDNEGLILACEYQFKLLIWMTPKNIYVAYMSEPGGTKENISVRAFSPAISNSLPPDIKKFSQYSPPSIVMIKSHYIQKLPNDQNVILLVTWQNQLNGFQLNSNQPDKDNYTIPENPHEMYFKKNIERQQIYYTGSAVIENDDGPNSVQYIHSQFNFQSKDFECAYPHLSGINMNQFLDNRNIRGTQDYQKSSYVTDPLYDEMEDQEMDPKNNQKEWNYNLISRRGIHKDQKNEYCLLFNQHNALLIQPMTSKEILDQFSQQILLLPDYKQQIAIFEPRLLKHSLKAIEMKISWYKSYDNHQKEIPKEGGDQKNKNIKQYKQEMLDNELRFKKQFGDIKNLYQYQDIVLQLAIDNRDINNLQTFLPEYLGFNNVEKFYGSEHGSIEDDFKKRWHSWIEKIVQIKQIHEFVDQIPLGKGENSDKLINIKQKLDFLLDQDSYYLILVSLVENLKVKEFKQCLKNFKKESFDQQSLVNHLNTLISKDETSDNQYLMFLYHLYENDNQMDECFRVLVRIGEYNIYDRFDEIFKGKNNDHKENIITQNITQLLQIDCRKTWEKLQQFNDTLAAKKAKVRECIDLIKQDGEEAQKQAQNEDEKQNQKSKYEVIENQFTDIVIGTNGELVDEEHFADQFNKYVKHNKENLLEFLKHGRYPSNAAKICAENQLHIEQAYVLLDSKDQKNQEEAKNILIQRSAQGQIQQCFELAIQFNFINDFFDTLLQNAGRKTADINVLLEYVDYLSNSDKIINQYDDDVKIKELGDNLSVAIDKLNLYISLNKAATTVSGIHKHNQFQNIYESTQKGFSSFALNTDVKLLVAKSNEDKVVMLTSILGAKNKHMMITQTDHTSQNFKCNYCDQQLADMSHLEKTKIEQQKRNQRRRNQANLVSSLFNTCNLTSTVQDQGFIQRGDQVNTAQDEQEEIKVTDFYMYKCGHKFHKDCMIEKLKIDPDAVHEDYDEDKDQDIEPQTVINLPTYKQRKKYVKNKFRELEDQQNQQEDHFSKCILCRQHDM